jgi:hypothetical protein
MAETALEYSGNTSLYPFLLKIWFGFADVSSLNVVVSLILFGNCDSKTTENSEQNRARHIF